MKLSKEDLIVFTWEDAKELETYMTRNRIVSLKQFASFSRVPYQTLLINMRLASAKQTVRMQKINYDKIKAQTKREICADLVNDGIIRFRRRLAVEILTDAAEYDRYDGGYKQALEDVRSWLDKFLGEENAKDGKSDSSTASQDEGVHQGKERCVEKEAQEKLDTSERGSSTL